MGTGMVAGFGSSLNDLWFDFTPFIKECSTDEDGNSVNFDEYHFKNIFDEFVEYVKEKIVTVWPSLHDPCAERYDDSEGRDFTPFLKNELIQIGWSSDSNYIVFSVRANEDRFDDFRVEQMKKFAENWVNKSWTKIQRQFEDCYLDRVHKTGGYTHQLIKKGV